MTTPLNILGPAAEHAVKAEVQSQDILKLSTDNNQLSLEQLKNMTHAGTRERLKQLAGQLDAQSQRKILDKTLAARQEHAIEIAAVQNADTAINEFVQHIESSIAAKNAYPKPEGIFASVSEKVSKAWERSKEIFTSLGKAKTWTDMLGTAVEKGAEVIQWLSEAWDSLYGWLREKFGNSPFLAKMLGITALSPQELAVKDVEQKMKQHKPNVTITKGANVDADGKLAEKILEIARSMKRKSAQGSKKITEQTFFATIGDIAKEDNKSAYTMQDILTAAETYQDKLFPEAPKPTVAAATQPPAVPGNTTQTAPQPPIGPPAPGGSLSTSKPS